jgi:hypothetical protein
VEKFLDEMMPKDEPEDELELRQAEPRLETEVSIELDTIA